MEVKAGGTVRQILPPFSNRGVLINEQTRLL